MAVGINTLTSIQSIFKILFRHELWCTMRKFHYFDPSRSFELARLKNASVFFPALFPSKLWNEPEGMKKRHRKFCWNYNIFLESSTTISAIDYYLLQGCIYHVSATPADEIPSEFTQAKVQPSLHLHLSLLNAKEHRALNSTSLPV